MADTKTFTFGDTDTPHDVGDSGCGECWSGYPAPCTDPDCDGIVHASFGDENSDCDYWLYTECDKCGEPE